MKTLKCVFCRPVAPAGVSMTCGRTRWVVLGALFSWFVAGPPPVMAQAIAISPQSLDLGTYLIGSDGPLRGTVQITNHSGDMLHMRQLSVSCGCMRVVDSFNAIGAGATESIVVEVRPENGPETESVKMLSIRLEGNQTHQQAIKVRWATSHPVAAEPQKLLFEVMEPGECRRLSLNLRIANPEEGERLNIKSVHASYPFIETKLVGDAQVQVDACMPTAFQAARSAELVVDVESTHRSFPQLRVPLVVTRVSYPILATPSTVILFQKPPPEGKKVRVRVFDRDKKPLQIDTMRLEHGVNATGDDAGAGDGSAAELTPSDNGNPWLANIELTVHSANPGSRQKLVIQFKDSSRDRIEIPIHHAYE